MPTPALSHRHAASAALALALALLQPHSASAQPWTEEDLESPSEVFCLASGDLDGNLRTDLVAGTPDRTVLVYLNGPDGLELAQTVQINDDRDGGRRRRPGRRRRQGHPVRHPRDGRGWVDP